MGGTFQAGVGSTNDRFDYSIDPKTGRILFVEFQLQPGVWPGVGGSAPVRSTWLDYKQVGPFTMHTRRVFYSDAELKNRAIGQQRESVTITVARHVALHNGDGVFRRQLSSSPPERLGRRDPFCFAPSRW